MKDNTLASSGRRYELAIAGTVGVPGNYGGFETLAEQLVERLSYKVTMLVICSGSSYDNRAPQFHMARLKYLPFKANGVTSVLYDTIGLLYCCWRTKCVLQLGISGALTLPLLKLLDRRIMLICNVDGIEWRRQKWGLVARWFLKFSEKIAVKYSDVLIADNQGIAEYLAAEYQTTSQVIPYGGDHVLPSASRTGPSKSLIDLMANVEAPYFYAVCRIVPENHVAEILAAFAARGMPHLVFVGNWDSGRYAKTLYEKYLSSANILLLNPIYDQSDLAHIRKTADGYIHGHSSGGTNPSLVEAMHFGSACIAYDCNFNAYTLGGTGLLWRDKEHLRRLVTDTKKSELVAASQRSKEHAEKNYSWPNIAKEYLRVIRNSVPQ